LIVGQRTSIHTDLDLTARAVLADFAIVPRELRPVTQGLINLTWQVETHSGDRFILQRLHPSLPPEVNLNLECVTRFLAAQGCLTPQLHPTVRGEWWTWREDAVWRVLTFIEGNSLHVMPDLAHATAAGRLLGDFHVALTGFTGPLPCPRPPVHEPARHHAFLRDSLARHSTHRIAPEVTRLALEIDAALTTVAPVATLPHRLVHGDPKLSNLLFGPVGEARCLVDLDTLTYAPLAYEIGDALRSWCNPQTEDAPEAMFDLALFEAALRGYASAIADSFTAAEIASFVAATETIHLELAMRFGADALNETYFGWDPARFGSRGEHNLRRARNQLACARHLGTRRDAATRVLAEVFPRIRALDR